MKKRSCIRDRTTAEYKLGFALCCHSYATRAPIADPPNGTQLWGIPYDFRKLHPGSCNSVGMRPRTDRHTDSGDDNTFSRRLRLMRTVSRPNGYVHP